MKNKTKHRVPIVGVVESCRRVHRAFRIRDKVLIKALGLKDGDRDRGL